MEAYLLKSALSLAVFFAFYKGILEQTSMHAFKRFYLLGVIALSFGIPLITFTTYVEIIPGTGLNEAVGVVFNQNISTAATSAVWPTVLWAIYLSGVLIFSMVFFNNLKRMILKIRKNPKQRSRHIINVLLSEVVVPHTFFNYIFLNKDRYEANAIPKEVLLHETTHAREKHSFDILFIEVLSMLFWFNPLLYLLKRSVKLNHEFLADRFVLRQGADTVNYQKTLLAYSSNAASPQLANSINYSFIKKRFNVMQTQTSKRAAWIRGLLIIPVMVLTIYGFSERKQIEIPPEELTTAATYNQDSATREEMKEYDRLAKKYNAMGKENLVIKLKDLSRLEYIYNKMSAKQKADAEPFPNCFPPPPPPAPDAEIPFPPPPAPKAPPADDNLKTPEPPGPPPFVTEDPIDHIIRMARQNTAFLYEDKVISSDEAIALLKRNKELYMQTTFFEKSNPIVKISKFPIPVKD